MSTTIPQDVLDEVAAMTKANLDPNMPPCPAWCTLPAGHPWDSSHDEGLMSRGHGGPQFGHYVSVGSSEYEDNHGVHVYYVYISEQVVEGLETSSEARDLAWNLAAASAWVEAQA
jgi:hypothetical protein